MNAAARLVQQRTLSRHLVLTHFFSRKQLMVIALAIAVVLSALSIIYVTHTTRVIYAGYEQQLIERDRLHVEQGQLLLERSTWMMPARIQHVAEKKLSMVQPTEKSIVIIHE